MKISKIKKSSNGKYKIYLDDNKIINTYDEVIIKNNLLYKKDFDLSLINELEKDNDYYNLYNKCVNLISKRIRSRKEIYEYLIKNTNDYDMINSIISKLTNIGLINDLAFTKSFIIDKLNLTNNGPLKIEKELLEHDIDSCIINEELSKIDHNIIIDKIDKIIKKRINNNKYSSYILKQKIITDLINNGYDKEDILNVLNNYTLSSNISIELLKQYKKLSNKYEGEELLYKLKNKLYQKGYRKEEIEESIKKMDI